MSITIGLGNAVMRIPNSSIRLGSKDVKAGGVDDAIFQLVFTEGCHTGKDRIYLQFLAAMLVQEERAANDAGISQCYCRGT